MDEKEINDAVDFKGEMIYDCTLSKKVMHHKGRTYEIGLTPKRKFLIVFVDELRILGIVVDGKYTKEDMESGKLDGVVEHLIKLVMGMYDELAKK